MFHKKSKLPIVILILLFNLSFHLYSKDKKIELSTKLVKDSVVITIINHTKDTILFSLYEQDKFGNKWTTSNYDIFCNISNPNTRILRILPFEKSVIINRKNTFPVLDDGKTTEEEFEKISLGKRRIKLIIVDEKDNFRNSKKYYISNAY